jgi:hypothetical protein
VKYGIWTNTSPYTEPCFEQPEIILLCGTLDLQEKSTYEKIYTKYCKTVLGRKKTACNISTLSELGRLPIASFIKTQVMMYFVRINTNNIYPLIKESLNINKSLHDEGFYTWYTLALNVFQEFDLDAEDFSDMDKGPTI